jgi:hypothetical protein
MANNLSSNVSTKVAKVIMDSFESTRVLTKTVNTSLVAGANGITNETGDTVYLKRPTQYKALETAGGDISALTKNDMGVGRIAATVQNYITVPINYTNLEEVTELNQLQEILSPAAEEVATRLELNVGQKLIENAGLSYGVPGTVADAWKDVSGMAALMTSVGMPMSGNKYYVINPFIQSELSSVQNGLNASDSLVKTAWENAQISANFAGMRVLTSTALNTYTSGATTDRAGTLGATPDATWATHKDTMIQTLSLAGLSLSTTDAVRPGDLLEFPARHYVNVATRKPVLGPAGTALPWRCTVVTGGNTDGAGAVSVTVTSAAIYGAAGGLDEQYTTIDSPLTSGDVVNVLGAADTAYQPNVAYHKNAFALATIKLPKLHATDTIATSKDGLSMRITKYSDGDKNAQRWRIDLLPVMGVINPLFIGSGFGN